jgi:hypothetical protein
VIAAVFVGANVIVVKLAKQIVTMSNVGVREETTDYFTNLGLDDRHYFNCKISFNMGVMYKVPTLKGRPVEL